MRVRALDLSIKKQIGYVMWTSKHFIIIFWFSEFVISPQQVTLSCRYEWNVFWIDAQSAPWTSQPHIFNLI